MEELLIREEVCQYRENGLTIISSLWVGQIYGPQINQLGSEWGPAAMSHY